MTVRRLLILLAISAFLALVAGILAFYPKAKTPNVTMENSGPIYTGTVVTPNPHPIPKGWKCTVQDNGQSQTYWGDTKISGVDAYYGDPGPATNEFPNPCGKSGGKLQYDSKRVIFVWTCNNLSGYTVKATPQ